ncbi:MAG: N-acetylmuramoyl-L-alanine amidase [Chthoniobacteraceae bacterium]
MSEVTPLFKDLVAVYAGLPIQFPQLKAISIAQWLLESARGSSRLCSEHFNFGGLKFRSEMAGLATPVQFTTTHDGTDTYCRFATLENFCRGYWRFMARAPYEGFENHVATGEAYIRFVGPIYAPAPADAGNVGYADKVIALLGEASALLKAAQKSGEALVEVGADLPEEPGHTSVEHVVVIDPGHGGKNDTGGSAANHATSASGVLEKTMTLDFARLVREALTSAGDGQPFTMKVILTRDGDTNLGLAERANVARDSKASVFLSIHFNGFNKIANGAESFVLPESSGNVNLAEDKAFAQRVLDGTLAGLRKHRPATLDRKVKEMSLGVLRDTSLGNSMASHKCRATLLEIEFIDVKEVDVLLNTGPNAALVRRDVAAGIAAAIVADLSAQG